jgi:predicted ArsR family transcriptional regulator
VKFIKVKRLAKALGVDPYAVRDLMMALAKRRVVDEYIVSRDGRGRTRYKIYVVLNDDEFNKAIKELRKRGRRI